MLGSELSEWDTALFAQHFIESVDQFPIHSTIHQLSGPGVSLKKIEELVAKNWDRVDLFKGPASRYPLHDSAYPQADSAYAPHDSTFPSS